MSVSQRKDGRWLVKYKTEEGWKQKAFRSEEEAKTFDKEHVYIEPQEPDRMTLGELAISYFQANERHKKTRQFIIHCLCGRDDEKGKHHKGCGEFLRDKYAEDLTRRDLETLRNNYRERHVTANTINHAQAHIRAILAWGADQQLISRNPWREFKRLPAQKRIISVSLDDFRAVYAQCPSWLQWAVKTAFCLALRPGIVELFRMEWSAFDWGRGIVRIRQGKTGAIKTVIPPDLYLAEARARYEHDVQENIAYVCTRYGRPVYSYHKAWEKACALAKIKMRPYDIRHLAASQMLAGGADLAAVAAQLGHASVTTTGRTYAHVLADGQARAARALPAL
ncbi:MAG: tyrosine-type recombinase/integrase [Desulfovibrionaceae bacterium]|nr:tyrosine-type recombinase/integrase [Desulfovibrionaceae bacterium]